jgi:hypothetical protein
LNHRPQHYECCIDISNLLFLLLFQGICSQFKAPEVLQNPGISLQNPYSGVEWRGVAV